MFLRKYIHTVQTVTMSVSDPNFEVFSFPEKQKSFFPSSSVPQKHREIMSLQKGFFPFFFFQFDTTESEPPKDSRNQRDRDFCFESMNRSNRIFRILNNNPPAELT